VPIRLDLTDRATIVDVVRLAPDVTLVINTLINNAGISTAVTITPALRRRPGGRYRG